MDTASAQLEKERKIKVSMINQSIKEISIDFIKPASWKKGPRRRFSYEAESRVPSDSNP